ncbi:hypothetical protein ETX26_13410 [Pelagerythrobacter rhizovicinus]|uniref:Uncharacterized protein n=2 Tax=Pelagerythrobacter rhizovicinus TaxID=2268576 RepID=A0A4Q2KI45_9SPHN|nr:hypothetical protein ETX26_13410 [Pelagerythrobacter rhizovicinus]
MQNLTKVTLALVAGLTALAAPAAAQEVRAAGAATYADLVDLADPADLVIRAQIRDQALLSPERAPGVRRGYGRLYVEARTQALIAGSAPIGESIRYLVDVPLDENGKPPKLKKREVILFARAAGRPGEIQLIAPTAQLPWSEEHEARLRPILAELSAPDAPPSVLGVRDILSMPGNLAGESETQMFLNTDGEGPVSITVVRRPNMAPVWGVSWTEIVDQAARPPAKDTLAWYRIACFLPDGLPADANLAQDPTSRAQAEEDFRFVQQSLGPCRRNRS